MNPRAEILKLHESGKGQAAIARELGIPVDHVIRVLRAEGIVRGTNRTRAAARGENLADPGRADRKLRDFSGGGAS